MARLICRGIRQIEALDCISLNDLLLLIPSSIVRDDRCNGAQRVDLGYAW